MELNEEEMKQNLAKYLVDIKDFAIVKQIGKGGYGNVSLGKDLKTGKLYAIKEMFFKELQGRELQLFCREVQILAKCDNLFLLPFKGFSLTYPYIIVTDYIPNGSLYEALRHRPNSPQLSPTNKTTIAMGIAYGMMRLHELNIIHRDLKSLNILLDERLVPKICDFGIARYEMNDQDQPITFQVGTPHWMAPEMFMNVPYDKKVDVYSFGILLWEILTEATPFRGKSPMQIMNAVCECNDRPRIPANAPEPLAALIRQCWTREPSERPSFSEIFDMFKSKKVMFEGADAHSIDLFLQQIEKWRRRSKGKNSDASGFLFLQDYTRPNYWQLFEDSLAIGPDKSSILFSAIANAIPGLPSDVVTRVRDGIIRMLTNDPRHAPNLFSSSLLSVMKVDFSFYPAALSIAKSAPTLLKEDFLNSVFSEKHETEFVELFSRCDHCQDILPFLFEISNAVKINSSEFYDIFLDCYNNLPIDEASSVFQRVYTSEDSMIVQKAYEVLASKPVIKASFMPSEELIQKHLSNDVTAISLMKCLRSTQLKISKESAGLILQQTNRLKIATSIMFKMSRTLIGASLLLELHDKWDHGNSGDVLFTLMEMAKHPEMQKAMTPIVIDVLSQMSEICPALRFTIIKLLRTLPLKEKYVSSLSHSGFIHKFIESCRSINDSNCALSFVTLLAKIKIVDEMQEVLCWASSEENSLLGKSVQVRLSRNSSSSMFA